MLCPQCGARNPLGVRRCQHCARPFTREALAEDAPALVYGDDTYAATATATATATAPFAAPALPAGRSARRPRPRRARPFGCLTALALLLVAGLAGALALGNFVVKPYVRDAARDHLTTGVQSEVARQLSTQVGDLPDGQVTLTDADVNQRIQQTGDLGPLDDVSVAFTPSGIEVSLRAYGLNGSYHATPRVVDGSLRLEGGALDGALGYVVPAGDLERIVNDELAAALSNAGYTVHDITLGQGQIVLAVTRG
jgi:hypothetical protein